MSVPIAMLAKNNRDASPNRAGRPETHLVQWPSLGENPQVVGRNFLARRQRVGPGNQRTGVNRSARIERSLKSV